MFKSTIWLAVFFLALTPLTATAEPITLKLGTFSSDRSTGHLAMISPFVDAVNAEGTVKIEVYADGSLTGRDTLLQPQMALDGVADITLIVPGKTPDRFPDTSVIGLPGLFRDMREATLVYTRLIALNALQGYDEFVVIGAVVAEPSTIHTLKPINTIDDLKGMRIRINNDSEAAAFEKLSAVPIHMEIWEIAEALSAGTLDGASMPMTPLSDWGIKRIATHHYMLPTSAAPLALVMSRQKFDSLPQAARELLTKYSGEWAAERFIEIFDHSDEEVLQSLRSDNRRTIVDPSTSDLAKAGSVFQSVITEWVASDPAHQALMEATNGEIAKLRDVL